MTQFENEQQAYEAYDEYLDEQPDVVIGSLSYLTLTGAESD